jgi:hypothetical protein
MNLKDIEIRDKIACLNDELDDHQETIEKIREIIDQLCSDYATKIDFWKTPYGQKILEIKGILNEVESE